jgi:beta-lactamase class A
MSALLVLVAALALPSSQRPSAGLEPPRLAAQLRATIAASGAEVAVALRTLDGKTELLIDADKTFHAASTMKVPVMIELFRRARAGALSLDDPLPVTNEFHSIVDGSVYQLSEGDDSDKAVYANVGKTMTLRELCEAMITASSNFAANLLIEKLGPPNVQKTTDTLGAPDMHVLRGVEDQKAFDKGLNNTTSARALLVLLEAMAKGRAVDAAADREMVAILERQQFNDAIPAGVPPGTRVAHKTGNITRIHHDAAIVFAKRPYVLVVLVRGIEDQKVSAALIATLSKQVWESVGS